MNTLSRSTSTCGPQLGAAILLAALASRVQAQVEAQTPPQPLAQAGDEALLAPKTGEIRLEGTVDKIEADGSGLAMIAASFTLPNGKTARIEVPKEKEKEKGKIIRLGPDTLLYARGDARARLVLSRLRPGWLVAVVGEDKGSGQPLAARSLAVWTSVREGKYLLESPQPAEEPEKAPQAAVAPQPAVAPPGASQGAASFATRKIKSVLENGGFDVLEEQQGLEPTGWTVPVGPAVSIIEDEEDNRYVLLRAVGTFDKRKVSRVLTLDPRWKTLKVSARVRARGLQPPPQPFENAHIGVVFQNAEGKELGLSGPIQLEQDTEWEIVSGVAEIPQGATRAIVDAGNFGAAGEFGLDDIAVEPDAAPDSVELREGFPEGSFESLNANGRALGWPLLGRTQARVEEEGGNHFLRLSLPKSGFASVDALVRIPPASRTLQVRARLRTRNLKPGPELWESARLGLTFLSAGGAKVGEWPPALQMKQDADWSLLSETFAVPEGAVFLRLSPQLLNTSGTLDIDDIQIRATP